MEENTNVGCRLVTQNLIVSAAYAETANRPTQASIRDFTALVDTFCLYDQIEVLGREINSSLDQRSQIGDLLKRSGALRITSPGAHSDAVAESAKRHLLSYLAAEDFGEFDSIVQYAMSPSAVDYGLTFVPDGYAEIQQGELWLRTTPSREDVLQQLRSEETATRGTTFLVRSFLYLGYADVAAASLLPDATRSSFLSRVTTTEQDLRNHLLSKIANANQHAEETSELTLARRSPLAMVLLERSGSRNNLAKELEALREELAPVRKRLNDIEHIVLFGKGVEVNDAKAEWKLIMDELVRSYGDEPHLISLKQILSFGTSLGELSDSPMKAKSWVNFLLGLPFDVLKRILSRRPVIELHRLREEIPGQGRLRKSLLNVFGEIEH